MTLTLELSPDVEERLTQEATRLGMHKDEYAARLLEKHLTSRDQRERLVDLLQSWIDEDDPEEHRETGEYLIHALDGVRLSDRKLLPSELQGASW